MELAEIFQGLVFASSGERGLARTATWILSIAFASRENRWGNVFSLSLSFFLSFGGD